MITVCTSQPAKNEMLLLERIPEADFELITAVSGGKARKEGKMGTKRGDDPIFRRTAVGTVFTAVAYLDLTGKE